jgi:hypothetical protein
MKILRADDAQDSDAPRECPDPEPPILVVVTYLATARLGKVF